MKTSINYTKPKTYCRLFHNWGKWEKSDNHLQQKRSCKRCNKQVNKYIRGM